MKNWPKIKLWWDDPFSGQRHELTSALPITLGREPNNTLVLNHGEVSRHHAELMIDDDAVVIRDVSSTNGVTVNEKVVRWAVLRQGDRFKIGPFDFNWGFDFPADHPEDLSATIVDHSPAELPDEKTDLLPPPGWRKELGDSH